MGSIILMPLIVIFPFYKEDNNYLLHLHWDCVVFRDWLEKPHKDSPFSLLLLDLPPLSSLLHGVITLCPWCGSQMPVGTIVADSFHCNLYFYLVWDIIVYWKGIDVHQNWIP